MLPLEALGFSLYALGLGTIVRWPRVALALGVLLVAVQSVQLLAWLATVDLGVHPTSWTAYLGAIAPAAALSELLLGIRLVLRGRVSSDRPLWGPLIGGAVVVLGLSGVVVQLTEGAGFVGWGQITLMPTGTGIALIGFGAHAIWWSLRRQSPRPERAPLLLGIAGVIIAVATWQVLLVQRGTWIHETASSTAETTAAFLDQQLLVHALALRVLAEEFDEAREAPVAEWTQESERTSAQLPAILGFAFVLPDGEVGWSLPTGTRLLDEATLQSTAVTAAANLRQSPDRLVDVLEVGSGTVVALSMPIVFDGQDAGRMVGLLDGERLIQHLLPREVRQDFAVAVLADDQVVSRHGWREDVRHVVREVEIVGATWRIVLWPNQAWLERVRSGLPEAFLVFGVGLALAVAFGTDLAQEARIRARQLAGALDALRHSHDLLEQRVAERTHDLRRVNEDLAASNQELEQFAGVASHDLKEPLHTISLYLQVLARKFQGQLDEEANRLITTTTGAVARMSRLIDDLLEYARAGSQEVALEPVEVGAVLEPVVQSLHAAITDAGATIERKDLRARVLADPSQVGQVLQNLIANALKFRGEDPLRIEVGSEPRADVVRVWVRDNGIGVQPSSVDRIFAMFDRGSSEAAAPGTGIGLATCKKIVERHGGQIGVESQPGEGSTFWFTLPQA